MSLPDDHRFPEEHRFPEASEWLDLPLPELPAALAGTGRHPRPDDFVARTLAALAEEQELDRQLQRLDRELPNALLQQFSAPAPSRQFAERTLQALDDARRQHWQRLLARHIAPEPSPQFVARTLQALAAEPGSPVARRRPQWFGAAPGQDRNGPRTQWLLLTAAAAAMLFAWFASSRAPLLPLEVRFDAHSSPAFAFHHGGSPLAAVLAEAAASADPWALPDAAADGLWLAQAEGR